MDDPLSPQYEVVLGRGNTEQAVSWLDVRIWLLAIVDLTGRQCRLAGTTTTRTAARVHVDTIGLGKFQ